MVIAVSRSAGVRAFVVSCSICASSSLLGGQAAPQIPIRTLAPSNAISKDSVGPVLAVRALSNGNVLVNDLANRRVVWFDAALGNSRVVIDTIGGSGSGAPLKV